MRMTIDFDESQFKPMTVKEVAKDIMSVLENAIEGHIDIFNVKSKEDIDREIEERWKDARFNGG